MRANCHAAQDLAKRLNNAEKQHAVVKEHFETFQKNNFTELEIEKMRAQQKVWLEDVIDMSKHDKLPNPYELSVSRSECS